MTDEAFEDPYRPSINEQREIEEILNRESRLRRQKNRVFFDFNSTDHFQGWLRINGIKWE